jgi:signal peptidase I
MNNQSVNSTALKPKQNKRLIFGYILFFIIIFIVALAIALPSLIDLLFFRIRVENISGSPLLLPGDLMLVNKSAHKLSEIRRGDMVLFFWGKDPSETYIKRVIGVPGDVVSIRNGNVVINGQLVNEPYTAEPTHYSGSWTVPADNYFVLGDNRNNSSDSHSNGFVPFNNVVGKTIAVYWPISRIRIIN